MRLSSIWSLRSLAGGQSVQTALFPLRSKMAYATMSSMSSNQTSIQQALTPELYNQLHSYWFRGHAPESLTPTQDKVKTWFMRDEANDEYCRSTYKSALEAIKFAQPTAEDLINPDENPIHTIGLLILLDQISRNIFRGAESEVVFKTYDPLALDISLRAVFPRTYRASANLRKASAQSAANVGSRSTGEAETPWYEAEKVVLDDEDKKGGGMDELPLIRNHLGYRMWFYSPLMHSESVKIHGWAEPRYKAMVEDMDALVRQSSSLRGGAAGTLISPNPSSESQPQQQQQQQQQQQPGTSPDTPPTSEDLNDPKAAKALAEQLFIFETQHRHIVERFGRYPHRNQVLGRAMTEDETQYLANGGLTFAS